MRKRLGKWWRRLRGAYAGQGEIFSQPKLGCFSNGRIRSLADLYSADVRQFGLSMAGASTTVGGEVQVEGESEEEEGEE